MPNILISGPKYKWKKGGGGYAENTISLMAFPNPNVSILPEGVPKWWPDRNSCKEGARVLCKGAKIEIIYCVYENLYSNICSEYWWLGKMITWIIRFNLHTRSTGRWTREDWRQSHGLYLRMTCWVFFVGETIARKQKITYEGVEQRVTGLVLSLLYPAGKEYICMSPGQGQTWVFGGWWSGSRLIIHHAMYSTLYSDSYISS